MIEGIAYTLFSRAFRSIYAPQSGGMQGHTACKIFLRYKEKPPSNFFFDLIMK
jgi:hypothetical protein